MRRIFITLTVLLLLTAGHRAFAMTLDTGLHYGIGYTSLGQDPHVDGLKDRFTFINFMLSGELGFGEIFSVEVDIFFNERGYAQRQADETEHSLYFLDIPLIFKVYPLPFFYIGTGFGFAFKLAVKDYYSNPYLEAMQGMSNFVDEKTSDFGINYIIAMGGRYRFNERFAISVEIRHMYSLLNMNSHKRKNLAGFGDDLFERFRCFYLLMGVTYRILE
jgi:hypothetical protein